MSGDNAVPASFYRNRDNTHDSVLCTSVGSSLIILKARYFSQDSDLDCKAKVPDEIAKILDLTAGQELRKASIAFLIKLIDSVKLSKPREVLSGGAGAAAGAELSPSIEHFFKPEDLRPLRTLGAQLARSDKHSPFNKFTVKGVEYNFEVDEVFAIVGQALLDTCPAHLHDSDLPPVEMTLSDNLSCFMEHIRNDDFFATCSTGMRNYLMQSLNSIAYPGLDIMITPLATFRRQLEELLPALVLEACDGNIETYVKVAYAWVSDTAEKAVDILPRGRFDALLATLKDKVEAHFKRLGFDAETSDDEAKKVYDQLQLLFLKDAMMASINSMLFPSLKEGDYSLLSLVHLKNAYAESPHIKQLMARLIAAKSKADITQINLEAKHAYDLLEDDKTIRNAIEKKPPENPGIQYIYSGFNIQMVVFKKDPNFTFSDNFTSLRKSLMSYAYSLRGDNFIFIENIFANIRELNIGADDSSYTRFGRMLVRLFSQSLSLSDMTIQCESAPDVDGVVYISVNAINRTILHAFTVEVAQWTPVYRSALQKVVDFLKGEKAGAADANALSQGSYPEAMLATLEALLSDEPQPTFLTTIGRFLHCLDKSGMIDRVTFMHAIMHKALTWEPGNKTKAEQLNELRDAIRVILSFSEAPGDYSIEDCVALFCHMITFHAKGFSSLVIKAIEQEILNQPSRLDLQEFLDRFFELAIKPPRPEEFLDPFVFGPDPELIRQMLISSQPLAVLLLKTLFAKYPHYKENLLSFEYIYEVDVLYTLIKDESSIPHKDQWLMAILEKQIQKGGYFDLNEDHYIDSAELCQLMAKLLAMCPKSFILGQLSKLKDRSHDETAVLLLTVLARMLKESILTEDEIKDYKPYHLNDLIRKDVKAEAGAASLALNFVSKAAFPVDKPLNEHFFNLYSMWVLDGCRSDVHGFLSMLSYSNTQKVQMMVYYILCHKGGDLDVIATVAKLVKHPFVFDLFMQDLLSYFDLEVDLNTNLRTVFEVRLLIEIKNWAGAKVLGDKLNLLDSSQKAHAYSLLKEFPVEDAVPIFSKVLKSLNDDGLLRESAIENCSLISGLHYIRHTSHLKPIIRRLFSELDFIRRAFCCPNASEDIPGLIKTTIQEKIEPEIAFLAKQATESVWYSHLRPLRLLHQFPTLDKYFKNDPNAMDAAFNQCTSVIDLWSFLCDLPTSYDYDAIRNYIAKSLFDRAPQSSVKRNVKHFLESEGLLNCGGGTIPYSVQAYCSNHTLSQFSGLSSCVYLFMLNKPYHYINRNFSRESFRSLIYNFDEQNPAFSKLLSNSLNYLRDMREDLYSYLFEDCFLSLVLCHSNIIKNIISFISPNPLSGEYKDLHKSNLLAWKKALFAHIPKWFRNYASWQGKVDLDELYWVLKEIGFSDSSWSLMFVDWIDTMPDGKANLPMSLVTFMKAGLSRQPGYKMLLDSKITLANPSHIGSFWPCLASPAEPSPPKRQRTNSPEPF